MTEENKKEYIYNTHTISLSNINEDIVNQLKELFQCTRSQFINQALDVCLWSMKNDKVLLFNEETNQWNINPDWVNPNGY